jgi:spore germination cell wall hydrolase CwlJ-like protein
MSKAFAAGGLLALIFGFFGFRQKPAAASLPADTGPVPGGTVSIDTPRIVGMGSAEPDQAELTALARTIWGEARGEGGAGRRAVAAVIMNRVRSGRYPNTVQGVVFQPWQFSMWNAGDPNGAQARAVTASDALYAEALRIARQALAGELTDPTGGALHYYASWLPQKPYWAAGAYESARIGNHIFLTGVS